MRSMLGAFLGGVGAIEAIASGLSERDWGRPTPCTDWTAADLVAHVRCAADDYNQVLGGVLGDPVGKVLLGADLAQHNAARLAALPPAAPLVNVAWFGLAARRFAERAVSGWQTTMWQEDGTRWAVSDYVGFCALEWHVHAWDLASSVGIGYRPACMPALTGWWRRQLPHLPLDTNCAWAELLVACGRRPANTEESLLSSFQGQEKKDP